MVMSMFSPVKPFPPLPAPEPPSETFDWDNLPGIYAKMTLTQLASSTVFPPTYLDPGVYGPNNFPNSVYYELLHYKWFRGIQIDLLWGDIESGVSGGVYDWQRYDDIMRIVDGIGAKGLNGANKKVLFLISTTKTFSVADATRILPSYLRTTGTAYSNSSTGPLYTGTAQNPTYIDMPRYDHLWGFDSNSNQATTSGFGYHLRTADYVTGLSGVDRNGNDIYYLRDKEYEFLQLFYDRYKDNPAFAGIISIEPSPLNPIDTTTLHNGKQEYDPTDHFAGRIQRLKDLKTIFTNHVIIETATHNDTYQTKMTAPVTNLNADCCITNKLGFTAPNFHLGVNTVGIHNARRYLTGEVIIATQCQGQDMRSISGSTIPNYWRWDYDPPDYGGQTAAGINQGHPTTKIPADLTKDANGVPIDLDPIPDAEWVIRRAWYFRSNMLIVQRIIDASYSWDWPNFVSEMENTITLTSPNTGGSLKDDPAGGLSTIRPDNVI